MKINSEKGLSGVYRVSGDSAYNRFTIRRGSIEVVNY
jgi:hypothetical protein